MRKTCCWLFCLGVRPDGDDADEHLALVIKTVLSQAREKHGKHQSLTSLGHSTERFQKSSCHFCMDNPSSQWQVACEKVTCHGKKPNFFELCPSFLQHRPAAIALLLLVL